MRTPLYVATLFAAVMAPLSALATPCPTVMIVLDRSGSMDETPSGDGSGPSKLDIAKTSIGALLSKYGDRIPFGYETFQSDFSTCSAGIDILVEPMHGASSSVTAAVNATVSGGGTNTGQAIMKAAADPAMRQENRSSYILLITDGEPNCPGAGTSDPAFTVNEIKKAATAGIKTFVIGFGQLPAQDQINMGLMADAGGESCTDASCNGKKFYAADSATALNQALDTISTVLTGEIGSGACDDSCYSNGCDVGQICVKGMCQSDPCLNVTTCANGDYCYTDGTSSGVCVSSCATECPDGQVCGQGTCHPDPCASITCGDGQVCRQGNCATDQCAQTPCATGLSCIQGQCMDDPCHYVICPKNTFCQSGTGACMATGTTSGMTGIKSGARASAGGCSFTPAKQRSTGLGALIILLLSCVLTLASRRRRNS